MKVPKARKLPSGSWFAQIMIDGVRHSVTAPTEKECIAEAVALKLKIKTQKKDPGNIVLREAYTQYIDSGDGVFSPSTVAGYKRLQRNTFQGIMDMKVRAITNQHIQREIGAMSRQGKSPKYISNAVGLLRPVLAMVSPDFNLDVNTPQKRKPDLRMLSDEEISLLVSAAAGDPAELPIMMALWMGMRLSEIRGAKHKDISFRDGTPYLHICRAIVDDESGTGVVKGTKSYAGDRTIQIPEYIMRLIGDGNPDDHIISLTGQAIYKRFSRLLDKAGIPHCRFHDLRRANTAAMIRLGVDSKYAQERNGWASDYMYKQVYGYVMQDKMDAVSSVIDSYFTNKLLTEN